MKKDGRDKPLMIASVSNFVVIGTFWRNPGRDVPTILNVTLPCL